MNVLIKAEREMSRGRLWRAREILERAATHPGYKPEVYEKLGNILLEMKDLAEAGKYLFLSGVRKPEYEDAIDIFLKKHDQKVYTLYYSFPRSIQLSQISQYPEEVAAHLRRLGFPETIKNEDGSKNFSFNNLTWEETLVFLGCGALFLFILMLIILGIVKLIQMIF